MPAFAGVDIGSVAAKAVIMSDGEILGAGLFKTRVSSEKSGLQALAEALERAKMRREGLKYLVATGYGRISAPFANATVTEISCHAQGAYFLNSKAGTVIDMGGQDTKVIKLGEMGQVVDFSLNDKCAAGTGRFLEVMADVFDVSIDQLGLLSLQADDRVPISSTCTVFAESEVISLMARGEKKENIINGIHYAIARRVAGLLSRIGIQEEVVLTGGVGKNMGMKQVLEEVLGTKLAELNGDPLFVGAIGAARLAQIRGGG